jgi:hypothetical protein
MNHRVFRVSTFQIVGPHSMRIAFSDGEVRTIDFEAILHGALYGPLREPAFFAQVTIDAETGTVQWPNGADFDPETLHDWPTYSIGFENMTREWEVAECREDRTPEIAAPHCTPPHGDAELPL